MFTHVFSATFLSSLRRFCVGFAHFSCASPNAVFCGVLFAVWGGQSVRLLPVSLLRPLSVVVSEGWLWVRSAGGMERERSRGEEELTEALFFLFLLSPLHWLGLVPRAWAEPELHPTCRRVNTRKNISGKKYIFQWKNRGGISGQIVHLKSYRRIIWASMK